MQSWIPSCRFSPYNCVRHGIRALNSNGYVATESPRATSNEQLGQQAHAHSWGLRAKQLGHPTRVISEGAAERADGTGGVLGGGGRSAQAQQRARRLESGLVTCAQHTPSSGFDNKNISETMLWIRFRTDSELYSADLVSTL
jgi:hypothetical protein